MPAKTKDQDQETEYLFRRYEVGIAMLDGMAGGIPMNRGLAVNHIARFSNQVSNDMKLSMKNVGEVTEEAMQKYMMSCSSVFNLDEKGIYIRGFQVNAMLKDAAQRMKATLKVRGLGNTIRDGGLHFPDRIYLGVEPTIVEKAVKPDNGPANIKIFQVAEGVKLTLPCAVLENGDLGPELFRQIWVVAQGIGLGANRHLGYGRFAITKIEETGDWNIADLFQGPSTNGDAPVETFPIPEAVARQSLS